MKKVLYSMLILIIIIFILPAIFTKRKVQKNKDNVTTSYLSENSNNQKEEYKYPKYGVIKLYHTFTSEIEEIPLDEYLYGVVSSEMPVDFEFEALKAQAIVARTYTIYQIINSGNKHENGDICDDFKCCQAWISKTERLSKWEEDVATQNWDKIKQAVDSTKGKIITYNKEPIDAFFHSNSGGITETALNVWGGTNFPYLQSVETSGETEYNQYNSEVDMKYEELLNKLKEKYSDIKIDFNNDEDIKIIERNESNRVKTVKFGNIYISGTEARSILGLKSTNFSINKNNDEIKFVVIGYGHGVGMSQTGADSMAKNGATAEEIIKHFYAGVEINYLE